MDQSDRSPEIRHEAQLLSTSLVTAMRKYLSLAMIRSILTTAQIELTTLRCIVELGEAALELDDEIRDHTIGFGDAKKRMAALERVNTAVKAARKEKQ